MQTYLILVLQDTGSFIRKWRLEKQFKSKGFFAKFDEVWKVTGKRDGMKVS